MIEVNELGKYLPDPEAQLEEESERLKAKNQLEADKKCLDIAQEYGGTDAKAKPIGKKLFDCRFKVWR